MRAAVAPGLEPGEEMVAWSRAWVSRDGRANLALAARTRDFAVCTDRRLLCWSTGFFTRRPRRRVLAERHDRLHVVDVRAGRGRRLRVTLPAGRPLRFDLGTRARAPAFAAELLARTGARGTPPARSARRAR